MTKILRPRLEPLGVQFPFVGQLNERVSERMRIEIGQAGERAGFPKDRSNRVRVRPMRPIETDDAKLEIVAGRDLRFRKERVFRAEALFAREGR